MNIAVKSTLFSRDLFVAIGSVQLLSER